MHVLNRNVIVQGFKVIEAADLLFKSLKPLMEDIRKSVGDHPTYISFDIDALDPAFAPGTGKACLRLRVHGIL